MDITKFTNTITQIFTELEDDLEPKWHIKPTVRVRVEETEMPCVYKFTFIAIKGCGTFNDVYNGELYFTLLNTFSDFTIISGTGLDNITAPSRWDFAPLPFQMGEDRRETRMLVFTARYMGVDGEMVPLSGLRYAGIYNDNWKFDGTATLLPPKNFQMKECMLLNENACNKIEKNIQYDSQQYVDHFEVSKDIIIKEKNKKLSIHFTIPDITNNQDINIDIFITEILNTGKQDEKETSFINKTIRVPVDMNEEYIRNINIIITEVLNIGQLDESEQPIVHQVIKVPANISKQSVTNTSKRSYSIDFIIDENMECRSTERTFRIRAKAHYLD